MRVAATGSRGMIGSALVAALERSSHEVVRVVRGAVRDDEIGWEPVRGEIEHEKFNGVDAVVHLAGESIAEGRWTKAKKERIWGSRVEGTRTICEALAHLEHKPQVLVSASAIGYYGDRGDEECTEKSPAGAGFLPELCTAWEDATLPAVEAGIRVVNLRIGVVLSTQGGALSKMLLPFKLGLGGVVGSGKQYWSWIALDDVVQAIIHCLKTETVRGPVNGVAPNAVTNREFTKTLGRVLGRPTLFPMPAFAARLALGEMADALLLCSAHVAPDSLQKSGFRFRYEELEHALTALLR